MKLIGYFNPRHAGDTFAGLNSSIDGTVGDRIIEDLPGFLKAAGRDYPILKVPAFTLDPNGAVDENGALIPGYLPVDGQYHLARGSDHRIVSPHTVTGQYAPLSLADMADELQPWCNAGWATPDGVYDRDGSLEMLSLRLDGGSTELPNGERFLHYAIFTNPHGGTAMASGKIISWRVVCCNTFSAAVAAKADWTITHRVPSGDPEAHKSIMAQRASDAVAAWEHAREHIRKLADRIEALSSVALTGSEASKLASRIAGIEEGAKPDDIPTRKENVRDAILRGFNFPQFGTQGKTAWDLYNGVTFANSSPMSPLLARSKVSALDRTIRNVTPKGVGLAFEERASAILSELLA